MKLNSLVSFVHAAHWSYLVGGAWGECGGIMLSAPPGSFKTRILQSLDKHDRALIMSDINVPTITRLRDDVAYGKYRTLAFTEFEKIYQRDPGTAANVEGHLRAMVDEGFRNASFQDQRMHMKSASCMVIGAMTPRCYQNNFSKWDDSGFGRRFLWMHYGLANPGIITEAIHRWERIKFRAFTILSFGEEQNLHYNLTEAESRELQHMIPIDSSTSFILLKKIACVLKHANGKHGMDIVRDVAPCFKDGGTMYVEDEQHERSTHHAKNSGQKLQRSRVRRGSNRTSKNAGGALRVPRLEKKRELSALPANGIRVNPNPAKQGTTESR